MAHVLDHMGSAARRRYEVRAVAPSRPLYWLRAAYADIRLSGAISLGYGALVAGFGMALLAVAARASYLVPALIGGFMLVAPFAAIVLYALSSQIEEGIKPDGVAAAFAWRRNAGSIALFGLALALVLIAWERLSAIIFALFYGGTVPDLSQLASDLFLSGNYVALSIAYLGCGAIVAAVVFSLSVVTAPMLLDQPVDVITAALTSLRCCRRNPGALALWAVILAVWTAIGFATLMLGLVLIFPWLGHASWHAYRDMVEVSEAAS